MAHNTQEVADALGMRRGQIDVWISRGLFATKDQSKGKARRWDFGDVLRLQVVDKISSLEIPLAIAFHLSSAALSAAKKTGLFLVIQRRIPSADDVELVRDGLLSEIPYEFTAEAIAPEKIADVLRNRHVDASVVIELDSLVSRVKGALETVTTDEAE
ncbi:MAG: MerR family transcriptional regulator [Methylocystis sp.]|uniref:MerR family transcriptional regulator n=1 Tax=Methylocystis sp. TaxID=1911079 RepID=UPI003DA5505B